MAETDNEVAARVKAGDREAYRELVERHSRKLYRLAYRMMGNREDAEDVVQESLLRAFRHIDRFNDEASFRTWLNRIAANYCLDLIRSRKRHAPLGAPDGDPERPHEFEIAESRPHPEQLAGARQAYERIESALEQLTMQERTAFLLRHCEGESIPSIAEALGVNSGAAKHSVFRAVQKLRRVLEPLAGAAL